MIKSQIKKARVEHLIDHLLSRGYITLSRKYGKYLPAPKPIGGYDVDAIAKYKKKIALGIILSEEELNNPNVVTKLTYLAKAKEKSDQKVTLFVGVPNNLIIKAEMILAFLDEEIKSRIKLIPIPDEMKEI